MGISTEALLDNARTALQALRGTTVVEREHALEQLITRRKMLEELLDEFAHVRTDLDEASSSVHVAEAKISEITGGTSVEEFGQRRAALLAEIEDQVLSSSIASRRRTPYPRCARG